MARQKASIPKAMRLAWDSLDSHLDSATANQHKNACCNRAAGGKAFHKKCVEEYLTILYTLYDHL